jgi:hypothetical protein
MFEGAALGQWPFAGWRATVDIGAQPRVEYDA